MDDAELKAEDIIKQIKKAGIRFIVALPDRVTSHFLLKTILRDPEFKVVQVCKEDEGISICSGLFAAGHRSLMMMQYTGLLDSVNSLRGVAMEGENPVCMLVGLLGKEPGVAPSLSKKYGVKIIEPILDAMDITHHWVEASGDTQKIVPAIEKAYADTRPMALLVGREPR
ncbi:MAG: decarboxylase [Candidatus Binatia bacterium]|jgi:sulfopyruvate decarboxylase subunit beta